jgi:hypothetical protein
MVDIQNWYRNGYRGAVAMRQQWPTAIKFCSIASCKYGAGPAVVSRYASGGGTCLYTGSLGISNITMQHINCCKTNKISFSTTVAIYGPIKYCHASFS